jgi:16S rRNA (guanine527-N7)-methyltransferase
MKPWSRLQAEAARLGVPIDDAQRESLARFHGYLVEANRMTNLTRIVEPDEAVIKHYLDSLLYLRGVPKELQAEPLSVVDVGAGPGLPGIPLLIARPHWRVTMVETVGKKVAFIAAALEGLGLKNGVALHGRAEDLAAKPPHRDGYDLATARALANMPELLELCLPFVKPGGRLVVSKGTKGPEELVGATRALEVLKGVVRDEERITLPGEAGERHLYVIQKHGNTPRGYPRKAGVPHQKPIC